MASKGSSGQGVQLSYREMEILAKAWQCFDDPPKINWQKLAEIAPFKNPATARACFQPIKKKLVATYGGPAAVESGETNATPKGRGKRKADNQMAAGTVKKAKVPAKPLALSSTDDDDDEYAMPKQKAGSKKSGALGKKAKASSSRKTVTPPSVEDSDSGVDAAGAEIEADIKAEEAEQSQDSLLDDEA
ncbi:hypothetical protein K449DRAFT_381812 [Hypoxylon sp. EC38]|nr:hypothetical protein K449DRAFT_381812 [Hypoxylon sp. EC38]